MEELREIVKDHQIIAIVILLAFWGSLAYISGGKLGKIISEARELKNKRNGS
jgi:hypothetical protein